MKRALGYAMIAAPFVAIFAFAAANLGVTAAILLFVLIAALMMWISLAVDLMA